MKIQVLLLVLFIQQTFLYSQNAPISIEEEIEKARFLITEHQKMTNIPGVQVALMIDGVLIWSESFGYADIAAKIPVTDSTQFRTASISKAITSIALGKLSESKQLDLDQPIRNYLPEFPERKFPVTARQLAASVSGIRHYNGTDPLPNTKHYESVFDATEMFRKDELLFEPGTKYEYSSFGWVLLSAVMERAAKVSFSEIMESMWQSLGMKRTAFDDIRYTSNLKTTYYVRGKNGKRTIAPFEDRSYMYAGGGYLSTACDLVNMGNQFIMDGYLSAATRQTLTTSYVLTNGDSTHYGLGWETGKSRLNVPVIFHAGSMSSTRTHLVIYPDQRVVFAYLANTGDHVFFNDREAQSIAEIFVEKRLTRYETSNLKGTWAIETTSLRDKKSRGYLELQDGKGAITFTRSKKEKTFPVIVTKIDQETVHLIAVTPMFIDLYLQVSGHQLNGYWLHDFNVKGIPEVDDYWKARKIIGEKIK